jgi:hypothetical protein
VEIEDAGIVLACRTRHHRAGMGLVRALVLGEADVAVQTEDGTLAVGFQRHPLLRESGGEVVEEGNHRPEDVGLIERAVGIEPFLALVKFQRLEKRQRVRAEALKIAHAPS